MNSRNPDGGGVAARATSLRRLPALRYDAAKVNGSVVLVNGMRCEKDQAIAAAMGLVLAAQVKSTNSRESKHCHEFPPAMVHWESLEH